jgi:hypothetical protein
VSLQFIQETPKPQPPDYAAIKKASDNRIQAAQEAARLKAAQLATDAERQRIAALEASTNAAKMYIYMHESGNLTWKVNTSSGGCGLGQALPCSKMGCGLQDYACQDAYFTRYMLQRYGSWYNAAAFWRQNHWW